MMVKLNKSNGNESNSSNFSDRFSNCISNDVRSKFMNDPIVDIYGVELTKEERNQYWDDVFDGGVPLSADYVRDYLWPRWGQRLGMTKPK